MEVNINSLTTSKLKYFGKEYTVAVLPVVDFATLKVLREKYYLVVGFTKTGNWGYTVVFNTEQKGVYNNFPKQ